MTWAKLILQSPWLISPHLTSLQKRSLKILQARAPQIKKSFWLLSSGTQSVGQIKALCLSHKSILCSAASVNRHLESQANDRWLVAIPTYHIGGLAILARAHLSRAKVNVFHSPWNSQLFVNRLARERITLTSLVPTQVYDLVHGGQSAPPGLRAVIVGGGNLTEAMYHLARQLGWPLLPSYGLTECGSQVATATLTSLQKLKYPRLKILDHVTVQVRQKQIFLKSTALCQWVAVATADGLYTLEDSHPSGWFATDDLGVRTGDYLKLIGRRDQLVKILGTLVNVAEIESRARDFFHVQGLQGSIGVVSVNSEREGARLILVTDSQDSVRHWDHSLKLFNKNQIGIHRLQAMAIVPQLPLSDLGKVRRAQLKQELNF